MAKKTKKSAPTKKTEDNVIVEDVLEAELVQETIDEGLPYGTVTDPHNEFAYRYTQGDNLYNAQLLQIDEQGKAVLVERRMRECPFCQDEYYTTPKEMKQHIRMDHPGGV